MRTNKITFGLLLVLLLFVAGHVSQAGDVYEVKCTNDKCGFASTFYIGGGFVSDQVSGYCTKCDKWVSLSWKRTEKAPAPFAEFWDPMTGTTRQVYKCPKCGQPFVVINDIKEIKFCPKCKKPTLGNKHTMCYD